MTTSIPILDALITDAEAAGATDTSLAPLRSIAANAAAVKDHYNAWQHPQHLTSLFTANKPPTGTQIATAAEKDAAATTAHAELTAALEQMSALIFDPAHHLFTHGVADAILAEINTVYQESTAYLQAIEAKWGTRTPNGKDVLARATGDDLDTIRGAAIHHRRLAAIDTLIDKHYASYDPRFTPVFQVLNLDTPSNDLQLGKRYYQQMNQSKINWFLAGDGHLATVQQARVKLNAIAAAGEQAVYGEARLYSHPKPEFFAKWTIKEELNPEDVEFNACGQPIDPAHLITHEEYSKAQGYDDEPVKTPEYHY